MDEFERLNAFVDGELSASEAAALSKRIAVDPALAAEVARLRALKAQVAALYEEPPPFVFPQPLPKPPRAAQSWRLLPVAAAFVLACGLAWTLGQERSVGVPLAADQNPDQSADYSADPNADHSAERRVMARYDFIPTPHPTNAPHIRGYQGARGCVLTIIDGARGDLEVLQRNQTTMQTYLWAQDGDARLIMAQNMEGERFAFFATVLADLWGKGSEAGDTGLPAQPPDSAPCVG